MDDELPQTRLNWAARRNVVDREIGHRPQHGPRGAITRTCKIAETACLAALHGNAQREAHNIGLHASLYRR
eukprot:1161765-Pelagomonas_calceolata.AAC.13